MKKVRQYKPNREISSSRKFDGNKVSTDLYDKEWMEYSRKFLKHNSKCYSCGNKSQVTDHLVPHRGDQELFWKSDNYLPLCTRCHNKVTALFDKRSGRGVLSLEKLKWLADNRVRNDITLKVLIIPIDK